MYVPPFVSYYSHTRTTAAIYGSGGGSAIRASGDSRSGDGVLPEYRAGISAGNNRVGDMRTDGGRGRPGGLALLSLFSSGRECVGDAEGSSTVTSISPYGSCWRMPTRPRPASSSRLAKAFATLLRVGEESPRTAGKWHDPAPATLVRNLRVSPDQ
jgi:hypothetical protein